MNDQQPEELNQNTTMTNTVTYATRTETSDLQFEGDVTSIRHNGECLLEKVEQLENRMKAQGTVLDAVHRGNKLMEQTQKENRQSRELGRTRMRFAYAFFILSPPPNSP